jgi:hypothetical protein
MLPPQKPRFRDAADQRAGKKQERRTSCSSTAPGRGKYKRRRHEAEQRHQRRGRFAIAAADQVREQRSS